jgi:MAP7 domain-containing protein 1
LWHISYTHVFQHNEIGVHSFGNGSLDELKNKVDDLDNVFIAFYREGYELDPGYVIINYIPPSTSAVKKGISRLPL